MAPLPSFRVGKGLHAFEYTGVAYFGPFRTNFGRREAKHYGCLFTCMQIRAVHIELVHDLTTDPFLMAFNRFISRRGVPSIIYSDHGSNFVGAELELRTICASLDQHRLGGAMSKRGVKWFSSPPFSSQRGGA